MKKLSVLAATMLGIVLMTACADADKTYVKKAVKLMDKQGLFAVGPEWEAARAEALAAEPQSPDEAKDIVGKALKVAGGKHSFILPAENVRENATSECEMPSVSIEQDGITLIKLPHFSGNSSEGNRYARTVLDALPDSVPGVVLDLRDNSGGNMYPMIAAVHRLLPDDNIISFRTRKRKMPLSLAYICKGAGVETEKPITCPIAILTNNMTGSSGEATLITFRGLDRVRVFGAPTAGYASANTPFPMPDGSQLVLTTGSDVARTGEEFCDDPIAPDVQTDCPMEEALAWLRSF